MTSSLGSEAPIRSLGEGAVELVLAFLNSVSQCFESNVRSLNRGKPRGSKSRPRRTALRPNQGSSPFSLYR